MQLLRQQQQFFGIIFILVIQVLSIPIQEIIPCNNLQQNCTKIQPDGSSGNFHRTNSRLTMSTSRQRSTTRTSSPSDFDTFSENLKRAALILAGIALGLGILRVCLMLCKSRSPNNSLSTRHSATVRPQVSTVEHHQFKPDLPPGYAEAIANMENEGGKLPSYEELPYQQRQEQHASNNQAYVTTQM